jgi:hypothetical protein
MNKFAVAFLFGTGILLGASNFLGVDDLVPAYIAVLIIVLMPVLLVAESERHRKEDSERAFEILQEAQKLKNVKKEVKSKIPANPPRDDSPAAFEGSTKVVAVRSMAMIVRKPRLREKIIEICDFADMVLETIRRMPADTPAAVAFAEHHLSKLTEALDRCFEMNKCEEYRHAAASLDAQEIECFGTFITAFRKQQENILTEGRNP